MSLAEQDDALIRAALDGSARAWDQLVRRHETQVYNFSLRLTGNPTDALDLMQEVFLGVYRNLHRFRGESRFSTWLFRIAHNKAIDMARRRPSSTSLESALQHGGDLVEARWQQLDDAPEQDPQAAAQAEAHRQECQRLLAWRQRQQQTFHQALLTDLQQMGPAAIALRQRGLSEETAKAWGLGVNGSRLMLPLRDAQGRTRAFSGRSLTGEEPKYLNSANDALFRKQDLLFGLDRAGPAIRRSGEALLVEGPLDVIQLHQAGLDHTVAS